MGGGVRPWLSAAMLAGFLLVAGLQLALVVVPVLLVLALLPGTVALRLGLPLCIATVGVMAYATWRALRTRRAEPAGVPVPRADAPHLWSLVDAAAAAAGVPAPDTVVVVVEATAALAERTRLLGLVGGRRDLYVGLPLLQAWDDGRLRAVVAHELAHGSPMLGRWAPLAYRGRVAVGRTVPRISRRNPAAPLLRAYANWYRRVDAPVSRAQELAADRIAADFAGAASASAVLRDGPALEGVQRLFYAEYLGPGWRAGHAPDDIFGGFLRVLAARVDDLAALRAREPAAPAPWDTHPPVPERLAALAAATRPGPPATSAVSGPGAPATSAVSGPGAPATSAVSGPGAPATSAVSGPGAPATSAAGGSGPPGAAAGAGTDGPPDGSRTELVPDLPGLGRALQAVAFPPRGRAVVGWDEFFGAARTAEMEREADAALGTLTRAAGTPIANAGDVLVLAADGRLGKVAETIFPGLPPDETVARIAELITLLLALAALRSGAARWRHSWTGAAELVSPDGGHLDLGGPAALATDPATVDQAYARLTALGIDPAADGGATRTGVRAEVVSGVVNLVVDGSRTDLLISDTGLFLVPGLPRSQNGSAKRRLARFAAADLRRNDPELGGRFVPYAEVAAAAQTRRTPKSWDLSLRDGRTLTLRTALDSDELPGGWAALDNAVAFLARGR
ncbi:M48 family metallopeptidase [Jidongwangia harbinensis]|uniref:M48 family metallopeptidase n=1 Tax=Jidongwangia harbinensis TaxID=2878561 RepID=UPI001CD96A3D|nr:M48 family metallopeptidase [Jidongwangia harbinensis]MCA2216843.1 peptidase [Jidongwangia harbinensis]